MMDSKRRVLTTLEHQQPDRVPLDLGSYGAGTTIHPTTYDSFKKYLGIKRETKLLSKRFPGVAIDEDLLTKFKIDTRPIDPRFNSELPPTITEEPWGIVWKKSGPQTYYPQNGPFQHLINPSLNDLERYDWPTPCDLYPDQYLRELKTNALKYLDKGGSYALTLTIPSGLTHRAQYLRGWSNWQKDIYYRRNFFIGLTEKVKETIIAGSRRILKEVGQYVDVVIYADDLGVQEGPMIKPDLYRQIIKPRQKEIVEALKEQSDVKVLLHSCGSVYEFLTDFIEVGFDALNPVQVSAKDMKPEKIKAKVGGELAFWGGIDTQHTLPYGTPQEVKDEVKRTIDQLATNGGYVLCAVHTIPPGVPPENIVALLEAGLEYGTY